MTREEKAEKVLRIVERFVNANDIHCAETIYQVDRVIENAYDFIFDLVEVAGYLNDEEDNEDE